MSFRLGALTFVSDLGLWCHSMQGSNQVERVSAQIWRRAHVILGPSGEQFSNDLKTTLRLKELGLS